MKRNRTIAFETVIVIATAALFAVTPELRGIPPRSQQQDASPVAAAEQDKPNAGSDATPSQVAIPVRLPKGKKLIMTDGSFQLAREYSVSDDRVRYWSVERSDWEEVPSSLVDWDATHKAEAEQSAQDAALKAKIHASDVAQRTKDIDVDRSLEIKPGLFLPDDVGFYALEDRLVVPMKQSTAVSKLSVTREVEKALAGVALIPSKVTLEIPGEHSGMRISTVEPEFFMRPADDREPRLRLLRAQVKSGHRLIDNASVFFGEETHHDLEVDFQTWTPANGVFRYTMGEHLEPGEYAFVEMTPDGISVYVWDFGIDAPAKKTTK